MPHIEKKDQKKKREVAIIAVLAKMGWETEPLPRESKKPYSCTVVRKHRE